MYTAHQLIFAAHNIMKTRFNMFKKAGCFPRHDKTNKMSVRPAKTQISLGIRPVWSVFAVRMKKSWVLSYPLSAQRRLWLDWADAQADLSLRWARSHFVAFVMSRLIFCSLPSACVPMAINNYLALKTCEYSTATTFKNYPVTQVYLNRAHGNKNTAIWRYNGTPKMFWIWMLIAHTSVTCVCVPLASV